MASALRTFQQRRVGCARCGCQLMPNARSAESGRHCLVKGRSLTWLCQTATAGKPGLTSQAKAMSSPLITSSPVEPDATRVARPVRRRLVEVIRSRRVASRRVISTFYPIGWWSWDAGDADRPGSPIRCPGRHRTKQVGEPRLSNPAQGVRANSWARSTSAGAGSFQPGDRRNRTWIRFGDRRQIRRPRIAQP